MRLFAAQDVLGVISELSLQKTSYLQFVSWHPHAMITAFKQRGKRQVTCWRSCTLVSRAAQLFLITGVKVNYPESAGVPEYFFAVAARPFMVSVEIN